MSAVAARTEAVCVGVCVSFQASENDRFVALELLKNANIAAGMVLPGCQDTGTAIIMGKRGQVCVRACARVCICICICICLFIS